MVLWYRGLPELERFPTVKQRRVAMRIAFRAILATWYYWAYAPLAAVFLVRLKEFMVANGWLPPMGRAIVIGLLAGFLGVGLPITYCKRRVQRSLREQLLEIGVAICLECGYDLSALTEGRCPECGTSFVDSHVAPG